LHLFATQHTETENIGLEHCQSNLRCFLSKVIVVMEKSLQVDPNKTAKVKYLLNCPKNNRGD